MQNKEKGTKLSRRDFMGGVAAATAAFTIVPRHVLGGSGHKPPSEKLNIAGIGVGGRGNGLVKSVASENIVALCDVDDKYAAKTFELYPQAKKYRDFRKMLDEQKDIDAVVIATPDHLHAAVSMWAIKMGKHVYCEKPLTHTIYEARKLTEAAREHKVATQMGNNGQASEETRLVCEFIWAGAIGTVREVHGWCNRRITARGIARPTETPPVPSTLDWDLWLGPAPYRPYHPAYAPFSWRGWWDFGTGVLGDIGCHQFDAIFRALKLGQRKSVIVEASSTTMECPPEVNAETAPLASIVHFEFPADDNGPAVELIWYDGGLMPKRPKELADDAKIGGGDGIIYIGDKGKMLNHRLIPESRMQEYGRPPKVLPRSIGHYEEWIAACKGGEPAGSNFDIAGPLAEVVLLGNIAIRTGQKLCWDGPNMKVTNIPDANKYIHTEYRQGWTL